jgi:OHCU decarboxylase
MPISLRELNVASPQRFVSVCGPLFEYSPWIAQRTVAQRPFATREKLLGALCATLRAATRDEQLSLVRAHPVLGGFAASAGTLTKASTGEQTAAGLGNLTAEEVRLFREQNEAYQAKFGFPFVICARENKKDAILMAFPGRLAATPEQELQTALTEIEKIARLRLLDAVTEE